MWTILYRMASPKGFYEFTKRWTRPIGITALLMLFLGTYTGLVLAPPDYQQGDAFRIIYVHVPCAFLSMSLFAFMGLLALLILIWRIKLAGLVLIATAETGICMTCLALITG